MRYLNLFSLSLTVDKIQTPEQMQKPISIHKEKRNPVIKSHTSSSYLEPPLGMKPLSIKKENIEVMNGLTNRSHILGSLENCKNLLTKTASICWKNAGDP